MTFPALKWAYEVPGLSPSEGAVLVALASMTDHEESCYPGQELIARMTRYNVRTVRRAIDSLTAAGLIVTEERRRPDGYRTSNRYYLQVGASLDTVSEPETSPDIDDNALISPDIDDNLTGRDALILKDEQPVRTTSYSPADDSVTAAFFLAYESWPKKEKRKYALEKWPKAVKESGKTPRELAAIAVAHARALSSREQRFVPSFLVWLNGARWEDDLAAITQTANKRDDRINTKYLQEG